MNHSLIAFSAGSLYSYGLNRAFALAAQAGFQGMEIIVDQRWDTRQADYLLSLQEAYSLPIVSLHSPFAPAIQGWERDPLSRLKRTIALAKEVGARHVVAHLPLRFAFLLITASWFLEKMLVIPVLPSRDGDYGRFLLEEAANYGASLGVTVAVENLPCRKIFGQKYNAYHMNRISEWSRFPNLTFDTTHLATWGYDILAIYEQVKTRIRHVHLSNYNGREHRLPWDGHLPLDELLRCLQRDRFAGIVCVELDPDSLEAADEDKVKEHLRRCYDFCAQHLRGPA